MKRAASFAGLAALAVVLAGCQPAGAPSATPPAGAVVVTANNLVFEQRPVEAPAGEAFTLWFENREGAPHNAHVLDAAGTSIARGEVFGGPQAQPLAVPALDPGTYRLVCDVHPGMETPLVAAATR